MGQSRQFTSSLRDTNRSFLPAPDDEVEVLNVAFILLEHFSLVSFTSAADALVTANLVTTSQRFTFSTVGVQSNRVISDLGIEIPTDSVLTDVNADTAYRPDMLLVCGGFRSQLEAIPDLTRLLKKLSRQGLVLGGIWNGVIALAHAGLLNEKRYALHPDNHAFVRENFPLSKVTDQAFVIEEKVISAAGPSSALEMMLSVIEELQGKDVFRAVREILACDKATQRSDEPMFNPASEPSLPQTLRDTLQLMAGNIEEPLTINELATWVGSSRRRIERLFQTHLNTSPSRYYLELRMTHARRLLLQSSDSIASVAAACGFVTATHFSHCFKEFFGISPTSARRRQRDS